MGTSPAFSFYARDFLTGTATMSLQEVGAYVKLLAYQWDAGIVPSSAHERARILGCTKAEERKIWARLASKFTYVDDAFQNTRLEEERQKQAERRRRLSDNGKQGGRPTKAETKQTETKSFPEQEPKQNLNERLAFASSSSPEPLKNNGSDAPPRPIISGEANPRTWGKLHGEHVVGFCDWVCLPEFLFNEFTRKSGGSVYVMGWAKQVRAEWANKAAIGDNLKFWRARWSESHPEAAVSKPKIRPVAEILAERERKSS